MEATKPASAPTSSFPFVLDCNQFYELMVAQGEGRSPMTSSEAETDSKPIIIIIVTIVVTMLTTTLLLLLNVVDWCPWCGRLAALFKNDTTPKNLYDIID